MSFKDNLGFIFSTESDEPVMQALEALGGGENRATAVLFELQPEPTFLPEGVFATAAWTEAGERLRESFADDWGQLETRCKTALFPVAARSLRTPTSLAVTEAAACARHASLSVMLRPGGTWPEDFRNEIFEAVLFESGRPLMLVPPEWKPQTLGRRVAIGWNGKREAARALNDAMPMLRNADEVTVMTVDARPELGGCGKAPGEDIAAHLARMGIRAALRSIDGSGRDAGSALLAEAKEIEADIIVVGGYGTPRLREYVFGGVTRKLSRSADIPVLLSH